MKPLHAAARGMLGAVFVVNGARAVARPDRYVSQAKQVTGWVTPVLARTSPRLPTDTRTLIRINGAMQLASGLLLVRGRSRRPAAAALAMSMVPTTLAGHPFWSHHDPQQRRDQQTNFLKNLGLVGGLLIAALDTEGRPGMRWRGEHLVRDTRRSAVRQLKTARRAAEGAGWGRSRQASSARVGRLVGSVRGRLPG